LVRQKYGLFLNDTKQKCKGWIMIVDILLKICKPHRNIDFFPIAFFGGAKLFEKPEKIREILP
jgi:hypothetical protein